MFRTMGYDLGDLEKAQNTIQEKKVMSERKKAELLNSLYNDHFTRE